MTPAPPGGFRCHAPEFGEVLGTDPELVRLADLDAHEGPVYVPAEDALYFTSVPRRDPARPDGDPVVAVRRLRLDRLGSPSGPDRVDTVRADANVANGMALDAGGRLVVCEQGTAATPAAITRLDPATGRGEVVVDRWHDLRLNSPNDVVVKRDGTLWFTDPCYGHLQGFRPPPQTGDQVYRYDPATGTLSVVADSFDKPNGLAFSPDERVLYIGDSGAIQGPGDYDPRRPHHVRAFDVVGGRHLTGDRLLAVVPHGFPDGLAVDAAGRVFVCCESGVWVFTADGDLLGEIAVPGAVNATFGGADGTALFITADTAVWMAVLAPIPDPST